MKTTEWTDAKNARRCDLIEKEVAGTLTPGDRRELNDLQAEMLAERRRLAPLNPSNVELGLVNMYPYPEGAEGLVSMYPYPKGAPSDPSIALSSEPIAIVRRRR